MRVDYKAKNFKLTQSLTDYVEKKLNKMYKYMEIIHYAEVILDKERGKFIIEITIHGDGFSLRAEERADDMYASIDRSVDKLERQIRRHKEKLKSKLRDRRPPDFKETIYEQLEEEKENNNNYRIKKFKRFMVEPMGEEEAIRQMEKIGHDFFIFYNTDVDSMNVIYKRKDGNYGIIEPVF